MERNVERMRGVREREKINNNSRYGERERLIPIEHSMFREINNLLEN